MGSLISWSTKLLEVQVFITIILICLSRNNYKSS